MLSFSVAPPGATSQKSPKSGWVSGADGEPHAIGAGEAVFWEAGEEHEIWTDDGLTMIVMEAADEVQPFEPRSAS